MLREAIARQLAGNNVNNGSVNRGSLLSPVLYSADVHTAQGMTIMEQLWKIPGNEVCADCQEKSAFAFVGCIMDIMS